VAGSRSERRNSPPKNSATGAIAAPTATRAVPREQSSLVHAWSRSGREEPGVENVELQELLRRSDFVSIHVALADETRNLLDAGRIAAMKEGAVLVNTARGGSVDEQALAAALDEKHLFAAGIDVFEEEPLSADSPLAQHPRVVLTPHIGSATGQTRTAMVDLAADNALAALQGKRMPHCFNPQVYR